MPRKPTAPVPGDDTAKMSEETRKKLYEANAKQRNAKRTSRVKPQTGRPTGKPRPAGGRSGG